MHFAILRKQVLFRFKGIVPCLTISWRISLEGKRAGHDPTAIFDPIELSFRNGLDEDVPDGSCLGGAGHHRDSYGIGAPLVQKLIAGATTDDVKDLDGIVCHGVQLFDDEAILQCQAFEDTSYIFAC